MLLQLLIDHPEALPRIVRSTPAWVWGLLAGLLVANGWEAWRRADRRRMVLLRRTAVAE